MKSYRRVVSLLLVCIAAAPVMALIAVPSQQVQDCTPLPGGIVSWWPAEGDATDIIGGHNGILQGGATFTDGMVGQAFLLDGVDSYVQIPHDPSFNPSGAFSVDAWIQANAQQTDSQSLIVDKSHGWADGTGWAVQTETNGTVCFFYGTGGSGDPSNFHGVCSRTVVLDNRGITLPASTPEASSESMWTA